jgi:glycosyltransferase involved in cell wall biosynthesis
MNLVVFAPANKNSAIGRMTALVTRQLVARGCRVTIVRTEAKHLLSTEVHDFASRIVPWNCEAEVLALIDSADARIYQVGDNFDFHAGCIHWLARFSGLVCLHDFFLGSLFHAWAQANRAQAEIVLQCWYGEEKAKRFFGFSESGSFIEGTHNDTPMTEWICSQATGVITHSGWGCERVVNSCPGPVRVVPLAYDAPGAVAAGAINTPTIDQTLQLLTIGHVNPNKRIASVIEAIGTSPRLKQHVVYRLVGAVQPEVKKSLSLLATRLGVRLTISGEVDENTLADAILRSDVISCLRWPALEAASASMIEAMLYGKAAIVTDTGFYAEIPSSCVVKIAPNNEINEIRIALEKLLEDRNEIKKLEVEAQRWSSQTFTAENYARQLIDVIEEISTTAPALQAIDHFCGILQEWSPANASLSTTELLQPLEMFERYN